MAQTPRVFFNASVILSGLNSPTGGSAKLLLWVKQKKIKGIISQIILEEVIHRAPKLGLKSNAVELQVQSIFKFILPPPKAVTTSLYKEITLDPGDAHVLASCHETSCQFLVSLDQKHILSLKHKTLPFHVVSPGELIKQLS